MNAYVGILRCQTWNTWPDATVFDCPGFRVAFGGGAILPARIAVLSYEGRSDPGRYLDEETKRGPLVWDGKIPGHRLVRDAILKSPSDETEISLAYRNAHRGEVDIVINFKFEGELPTPMLEALRATAYATMSLVNLKLKDVLTVAVPFQVRKVLDGNAGSMDTTVLLHVHERHQLEKSSIAEVLASVASLLANPPYGEKFRVALELYAAHFNEEQGRVRFLLLVIAMESLAISTKKHETAMVLLNRWKTELTSELAKLDSSSEAFMSLEALKRELVFREEDSIRTQIRKLFTSLEDAAADDSGALQRKALHVYDKRSTLVHEGHLPSSELVLLEDEARKLLEMLFLRAVGPDSGMPHLGCSWTSATEGGEARA